MLAETFWQGWTFLLSLSKVQLIVMGLALALLVAVSKILRFLFLLGMLVIFVTVFLPSASKLYEQTPVRSVVDYLWQWGVAATQDPKPEAEPPAPAAQSPVKEQ